MTTNNLLLSPEITGLNYRLSMLNALVDGLNHAISNTEIDLLEAQGLSTEDDDPWAFTAPEGIAQEETQAMAGIDQLTALAINHLKLNPLSEKRVIWDSA